MQTGDWLTQGRDTTVSSLSSDQSATYNQVTAFQVARNLDAYETEITYEFVFEDETTFEFTILFVRAAYATNEYQITGIEDLIDTYYGLDHQFYISLDWLDDRGETMHIMAEGREEFGFLFYSERSDVQIESSLADGTSLIYETGDYAEAVERGS